MGSRLERVPERIRTGSPETDEVLHGGFPAHSINIIMGAPGAGKTVLAEQLLFHNADGDRPVVYVSTVSEPMSKMLAYLQRFSFYDESKMLGSVVYEDIGPDLLEHGVSHLGDYLATLIRERRPQLLVIDSFKAINELADSQGEMRRLSVRLAGLLSAYDITTFLVGEYLTDDVAVYPEFAIADGIIELARLGTEKADERYLRVLKLRGSGYLEGIHAFTIDANGLHVFPRLVTPQTPHGYVVLADRLPSGIPGLDPLLGGGLWRDSAILVLGDAGTGKTTFGLNFALDGMRAGEPCLFVNLQENPTQLAETVKRLDGSGGVQAGPGSGLHFLYTSPVELRIDAIIVDMFRTVRDHDIRRVVVDGLGDLRLAAASTERFHDFIYAMTQHFKANDVTTLLTLGTSAGNDLAQDGTHMPRLATLADALISLSVDFSAHPPRRLLRVLKMRGSEHSLDGHPFTIAADGLHVHAAEDAHD